MANFKVGDEVICISAIAPKGTHWPSYAPKPVAGKKYIVSFISGSCVSLQGWTHEHDLPCNRCGGPGSYRWHMGSWRFMKLDGLSQEADTCMERDLVTNE